MSLNPARLAALGVAVPLKVKMIAPIVLRGKAAIGRRLADPLSQNRCLVGKQTDAVILSLHHLLGRILAKDHLRGVLVARDLFEPLLNGGVERLEEILAHSISGIEPEFPGPVSATVLPFVSMDTARATKNPTVLGEVLEVTQRPIGLTIVRSEQD